jgi:hypothetical protein
MNIMQYYCPILGVECGIDFVNTVCYHILNWFVPRICNSTLFSSENSSCLDVQNILMNDETNMDAKSPYK